MSKKNLKTKLTIIFFNLLETGIIFFSGKLLKIPLETMLIATSAFFVTRMFFNVHNYKSRHYKSAYKCMVFSLFVALSLFCLTDLGWYTVLLLSVFAGYTVTNKSNITEIYMWKGKSSKYQDIFEYVKYNSLNPTLIEFEKVLKEKDGLLYLIYKYRFVDCLSYAEISRKIDMETNRINDNIEKIALSIRMYCKI